MAGCGGGDDGGDSDNSDDSDNGGNTATQTPAGCGPAWISYTEFDNPDSGTVCRARVPESATTESRSGAITRILLDWDGQIDFEPYVNEDTTVQELVDGETNGYSETTDSYDFAVDGTRSFQSDGYDQNRQVFVPDGNDVVTVFLFVQQVSCASATTTAYTELVESIEPL